MFYIKKLFYSFFFSVFIFSSLSAKEDFKVESQPAALSKMTSLPCDGILKQKENGFVFLDVSNAYIDEIVPLLELPGELRPRPTKSKSIGAHISVFHEKEEISPVELGTSFSFEPKEIRSFTLHTRDGLKKLWVVACTSPDLENLRSSQGLSPRFKGYDFHITLGKQMPIAPENFSSIEVLSFHNFSQEPTLGLSKEGDFVSVKSEEVLSSIQNIQGIGQLKLKSNGYVYLDVSNEFIENSLPFLPIQNAFYEVSTKSKSIGAHISVMLEDEMIGKEIWFLKEAGEWFTFSVEELRYVDRKTVNGMERLWLLAVKCPSLERLRTSYGLKPKLKGHDFHITLGYEDLFLEQGDDVEQSEFFSIAA